MDTPAVLSASKAGSNQGVGVLTNSRTVRAPVVGKTLVRDNTISARRWLCEQLWLVGRGRINRIDVERIAFGTNAIARSTLTEQG